MANRLKALRQAWFWRPFSLWRVRRRGASDGKLVPPVPPWNATDQPPFVMEIKCAGDGDLQLITLAWDQADRELKTRYTEADRHYDQRLQVLTKCEEEFAAAVQRYEEINKKPTPSSANKSGWFYLSIATLISVFEIPLNLSFFRLFGESEVLTIVATSAHTIWGPC